VKNVLESPQVITEFFYVNRSDDIGSEEFKESCESILNKKYDFFSIFDEISNKENRVTKENFSEIIGNCFQVIESFKSRDQIMSIRSKLRKKYKNFLQAFEDLSKTSREVRPENIFQSLNLKSTSFLCLIPETMTKYQFKKFWFNKEELCCVDFCQERILEYEFCDQHFKGILIRGEEALGKIYASASSEKCLTTLSSLLKSLKQNKTPIIFPNINKRDIRALQIYLKYKQDKKTFSMTNTPSFSLNY
jgi:hypothetical protein